MLYILIHSQDLRVISSPGQWPMVRFDDIENTEAGEALSLADIEIMENIHGIKCCDAHGTTSSLGSPSFMVSWTLSQSRKVIAIS
jgi:hypothetical protein